MPGATRSRRRATPASGERAVGIAAGITWGFAPPAGPTWWTQHGCNTQPSSQDTCQRASDTYGIAAGVTFGDRAGGRSYLVDEPRL